MWVKIDQQSQTIIKRYREYFSKPVQSKPQEKSKNMDFENIQSLKVTFIKDIADMPFQDLRTEMTDNKDDLITIDLDISKVIALTDFGFELYNFIIDDRTKNLIIFIQNGNKLIPPHVINVIGNKWTILDGKHRIALCVKLGLSAITFLIRKKDLGNLLNSTR